MERRMAKPFGYNHFFDMYFLAVEAEFSWKSEDCFPFIL